MDSVVVLLVSQVSPRVIKYLRLLIKTIFGTVHTYIVIKFSQGLLVFIVKLSSRFRLVLFFNSKFFLLKGISEIYIDIYLQRS